jgi:hypothetical protein
MLVRCASILTTLALLAAPTAAGTITIFSDDFEDDTAGQHPGSPWDVSGGSLVKIKDFSGDKALGFDNDLNSSAHVTFSSNDQQAIQDAQVASLEIIYLGYTNNNILADMQIGGFNSTSPGNPSDAAFLISIDPGSNAGDPFDVFYYSPTSSTYVDSGVDIDNSTKQRILIEADFDAQQYVLTTSAPDGSSADSATLAFASTQTSIRSLLFESPNSQGSWTYIDDIELTIPEPSCLMLLVGGLVSLAVRRRRAR